ncbi:hypothetical protein V6N11_019996 [Hibiscus sabdariffa]|uniref:Alcohol dehydrogenase-like C-terminal domain-containing protein n=1 Tax=Hibiscus sabdariffa TaxID=183260 RepID=A0ABR1ZFP9_9ROSI
MATVHFQISPVASSRPPKSESGLCFARKCFEVHGKKVESVEAKRYFPNGIDVYLDNVGGKMLEAVLNHVNLHARIPVCGMISQYNQTWIEREGIRNLLNIVGKEVRMEGYLLGSYLDRFADFAVEMGNYIKQGKISSKIKIYEGIESFAESLGSVFSSSNTGKVIIEVKPQQPA